MSKIEQQEIPQRLMSDVLEKANVVNDFFGHIHRNGNFAMDCKNAVLGRKVVDLYHSTATALGRALGDGWATADVTPGSSAEIVRDLHQAALMFLSGTEALAADRRSSMGRQLVETGRDAFGNAYKHLVGQTALNNNPLDGMRLPSYPSE